ARRDCVVGACGGGDVVGGDANGVSGGVLVVFFLQAEDGIRDWSVTGVQTCALPISAPTWPPPSGVSGRLPAGQQIRPPPPEHGRSEERRVGKEWRSRGPAEQ